MSNNNGVKFPEVPLGTVLGRIDNAKPLRRSKGAVRYMVVDIRLTDGDGGYIKGLMNLGRFNVVTTSQRTYDVWKEIPFEVLEANLTIKDPVVED